MNVKVYCMGNGLFSKEAIKGAELIQDAIRRDLLEHTMSFDPVSSYHYIMSRWGMKLKEKPDMELLYSEKEQWQEEMKTYISVIYHTDAEVTANHIMDTVDTSYMKCNNEGDEIGWVTRESQTYVGTVVRITCDYSEGCFQSAANLFADMTSYFGKKIKVSTEGGKMYMRVDL